MRKSVLFIWNICLLALVPLLVGCDKDDDKTDLIIVESFVGTDGMEGEKIIQELKDVPAVVRYETDGYVTIYYSEYADEYFKDEQLICENEADIAEKRIGIALESLNEYAIPSNSKVYVSASITNIIKFLADSRDEFDWGWGLTNEERMYKKAYLKNIKERN